MFLLARIDINIYVTITFTDNLAEIDFLSRRNEHSASVLQVINTVSCCFARFKGNETAARTTGNISLPRGITVEDMVHNTVTLRSR